MNPTYDSATNMLRWTASPGATYLLSDTYTSYETKNNFQLLYSYPTGSVVTIDIVDFTNHSSAESLTFTRVVNSGSVDVFFSVLKMTVSPILLKSENFATAFLKASVADVRGAFRVDVDPLGNTFYVHAEMLAAMFTQNPAYAKVNDWTLEQDYVNDLAFQILGDGDLSSAFSNLTTVLADVEEKCAAAARANQTIVEGIGAYGEDDLIPLNICKIAFDKIKVCAPERVATLAPGLQPVPFLAGDSLMFELVFENSAYANVAPRNYFVKYVLE